MRTGIGPAGPGTVRFSTLATSSPGPLSSTKPAAASRASGGDSSLSAGSPAAAICSSRPAAAGSRAMFGDLPGVAADSTDQILLAAPALDSGPYARPMSAISAIGNTPVVRLERLAGEEDAEVWVKLEGANPTGSYKDRMALSMIEAAERGGRLQAGE